MEKIFTALFILLFPPAFDAQAISWTSDLSDKTFCLNQGSCDAGNAAMSAHATGGCSTLNYSYRIDFQSNGVFEIFGDGPNFNLPLPPGTHRIIWRANDNCGNVSNTSQKVTIKDCEPPNVACVVGLTQSLNLPECSLSVAVGQFILNALDNCTPPDELEFAMRLAGDGTGFPTATSLFFDDCQVGTNFIEIWVKDTIGLLGSCQTYVLVQNHQNLCTCNPDGDVFLEGCVRWPDSTAVENFQLKTTMISTAGANPPLADTIQLNIDSCFSLHFDSLPFGVDLHFTLDGQKTTDFLDKVTTFDLLQISRHILGTMPFNSVYQLAAADANNSGGVTTNDIVELRKLILGVYDTLPERNSLDVFLALDHPENLNNFSKLKKQFADSLLNLQDDETIQHIDFVAVKTGDVSGAALKFQKSTDREPAQNFKITTADRHFSAGEIFTFEIKNVEEGFWSGWQFALKIDPAVAEFLKILPANPSQNLPNLTAQNFSFDKKTGQLRAIWWDGAGHFFKKNEPLFSLKIKVLKNGNLKNALFLNTENFKSEAIGFENELPGEVFFQVWGNEKLGKPAIQFLPPQPNPFSEKVKFEIFSNEKTAARIQFFDSMGRLVFEKNQDLPEGKTAFEILGNDLPGTGFYFFKMQAGGQVFSGKLVKK